MSERIARPATADNVGWNTGSVNPEDDPTAQRAAGWGTDAEPASSEFNYLQAMWGDFLQWQEAFNPREWTDVVEGITSTVKNQLFRVFPAGSGGNISGPLSQEIFNVVSTGTGGGNPVQLVTDGEQLYYIGGGTAQMIVGADPTDGSEIWEHGIGASGTAICTDGAEVYFAAGAAKPGLRKLNRVDGVVSGNAAGTGHSYKQMRANGAFAAAIAPSGLLGTVDVWTVATPTFEGNASPTTSLLALGMDAKQIYVGGVRNTNDIWCYRITTGSVPLVWQIALDTNDPGFVNAIVADGKYVYVCTDRFALNAGGYANLFCLSRYDGALLWSADIGTTVDLDQCAVDDCHLYVIDDGNRLYQIWLRGTDAVVLYTRENIGSVACDGISIAGQDAATPTNIMRRYIGTPTKTFMRVAGNDPNRRPFFTLAIPIGGRI